MMIFAMGMHDLSEMAPLEIAVVLLSAAAVAWCIWRSVRLTLEPGEEDRAHVKYVILDEDSSPRARVASADQEGMGVPS